jgi:putative glycosyltransferase (TIGR04348 family)
MTDMDEKAPVLILSPATASSNNGNWRTAARWQKFLSAGGPVIMAQTWSGEPVSAAIALNGRRSAGSIARFSQACPDKPLAVVLTGTDLYGDMTPDSVVHRSLQCASHIVVLQSEALRCLNPSEQAKARVILQSTSRLVRLDKARRTFDFVAVGHLREEKDPFTLMAAARWLDGTDGLRILHIGAALDLRLGDEARRMMQQCPHYRWLEGMPAATTRRWIARSRALVHMSRLEGGAHAVIEAVRSDVPVLASRIDGNVGLLGEGYEGYFPVGDAAALAGLMRRFQADPAYAATLQAQCAERDSLFAPAAEARAVRILLKDMLSWTSKDSRACSPKAMVWPTG